MKIAIGFVFLACSAFAQDNSVVMNMKSAACGATWLSVQQQCAEEMI